MRARARSFRVVRLVEIRAIGEDEAAVIELDCPSPTGFGDADVPDGDSTARRFTEVVNDDAGTSLTVAGADPHPLAYRQAKTIRHGPRVICVDPVTLNDAQASRN